MGEDIPLKEIPQKSTSNRNEDNSSSPSTDITNAPPQTPTVPLLHKTDAGSKTALTPLHEEGQPPGDEVEKLTVQEKKKLWKRRWMLIAGLFFPYFLNAIDTTVIATALPFIASDFSQLSQQSWIVTSFTITGTAFIPAFGQLCDVFGRHSILQFSLALVWVGSALCAGAQNFGMLLLGRAIVGISYSGLLVVTTVVLGDKVSLKENALQTTLFAIVSGISFGVGPIIGGHLTSVNWRWCFGLSIPVAILSHILVFFCCRSILVKAQSKQELSRSSSGHTLIHQRSLSFTQKLAVVDWEGMFVFMAACVCVILALSWGGTTYAWDSPHIISLLVAGAVLLVIFFCIEKGMEDGGWLKSWAGKRGWLKSRNAMIPLKLFNSKDVCILALVNFAGGASIYSMFYFISTYFVIVESYSSSRSGLQLLYFLPGLGGGAYTAMALCNRWPAQTFPPIFLGSVLGPIAHGILTRALRNQEQGLIVAMMVLIGFANGLIMMPVPMHAIARKPRQLAQVLATLQFFKPLGGTVVLAVMGSVLNNEVGGTGVGGLFGESGNRHGGHTDIGELLSKLPEDVQKAVQSAVKEGISLAFLSVVPMVALAGVLAFGLGNVHIDFKGMEERTEQQAEDEAAGMTGWVGAWQKERPALLAHLGRRGRELL